MYKLVMILIVGGCALAYHGYSEYSLGREVRADANEMTCRQLADNGPGDNAHIVLTKYFLCRRSFIGRRPTGGGPWSEIWMPVVPTDSSYAQQQRFTRADVTLPSDVRVLIKSDNVHKDDELDKLATGRIEGIVINKIESLGDKQKEILAKSYPDIDFDKCWIVEEGRTVGSPVAAMGFMGSGAVLAVLGLIVVGRN